MPTAEEVKRAVLALHAQQLQLQQHHHPQQSAERQSQQSHQPLPLPQSHPSPRLVAPRRRPFIPPRPAARVASASLLPPRVAAHAHLPLPTDGDDQQATESIDADFFLPTPAAVDSYSSRVGGIASVPSSSLPLPMCDESEEASRSTFQSPQPQRSRQTNERQAAEQNWVGAHRVRRRLLTWRSLLSCVLAAMTPRRRRHAAAGRSAGAK